MSDANAVISGPALMAYRKSIHMSRNSLGVACAKSGQWIGNIEKGQSFSLTDLELYKLAGALSIKPEDLTGDAK